LPEQPETLLRLEALRRDINSRAGASVLWFIFALALAFVAGWAVARYWR
jgi:hypothetical protein